MDQPNVLENLVQKTLFHPIPSPQISGNKSNRIRETSLRPMKEALDQALGPFQRKFHRDFL